jgi:hypothetical protein
VALRAEAAVLAGSPDARDHVAEARDVVAGNPVARALVQRAQALLDDDQDRLLAAAAALDASGCRYQSARTLALAAGDHAIRGEAAIADLGLAPMVPIQRSSRHGRPAHRPAADAPAATARYVARDHR